MLKVFIPEVGESIVEVVVASWIKNVGDFVATDEPIAEIETDKVTFELLAPSGGIIKEVLVEAQGKAKVNQCVAHIEEKEQSEQAAKPSNSKEGVKQAESTEAEAAVGANKEGKKGFRSPAPSAEKMLQESNIPSSFVQGTGKDNQILKKDVVEHIERLQNPQAAKGMQETKANPLPEIPPLNTNDFSEDIEIKPMSSIRKSIAKHLLAAQHNAAMLTTFNEVNMHAVMQLRSQYKDQFLKKYGVKLGFMSFFARAVTNALKAVPSVNSEIQKDSIAYKKYYHIGVAVSTEKGLIVPVIRFADKKSFAGIELEIANLAEKARLQKISLADLQGGTFTITNGGIYGSMMSTPILNAPQTAILGMHNIVQRPIVENNEIAIKPMMYLALSYDHQVIDGKEAVTFLKIVKESIEDPSRILLDI